MKKLIFILLLISSCALAQPPHPPEGHGFRVGDTIAKKGIDDFMLGYKIQPSTLVLVYFSGFFKGYHDVLDYHYPEFKRLHMGANDQWWNPDLSWKNKYKDGTPPEAAFFGSKTIFVDVTSADHSTSGLSKYCMIGGICIKIGEKRKPFKFYVCDFLLYTIAYQAGFWTTYELIYAPSNK
jgi:hypothetical protein